MHNASLRHPGRWCLVMLLLSMLCGRAFAHKVNIFATVQADGIEGECYFSGGGRPKNCLIEFFDTSGNKLGETRTDEDGRFAFEPVVKVDHLIILKTADGHRAEFTVSAEELPDALPVAGALVAIGDTDVDERSPAASEDLERRVAQAVTRAIRPLRGQIDRLERRNRLRDILGGIGYIFGLAGLALYFKYRQRTKA